MPQTPETHEPTTYRIPTPDGGIAKLQRTWTDTQIVFMLRGALTIVSELDPPGDLRGAVFASALNLTGQMTHLESGLAVAKRTFEG